MIEKITQSVHAQAEEHGFVCLCMIYDSNNEQLNRTALNAIDRNNPDHRTLLNDFMWLNDKLLSSKHLAAIREIQYLENEVEWNEKGIEEWREKWRQQKFKTATALALLDAFMLQHAPDDLSPEQIKRWGLSNEY